MGHGMSVTRLDERLTALTHGYVDAGRLPCVSTVVARRGEVVHRDVYGMADIALGRKAAEDTVFRIYSMTKPIASVAFMTMYEQGLVLLENPVSRFIPAFASPQILVSAGPAGLVTRPATSEMTLRDLLVHTSGLTAWFQGDPVAAQYREHRIERFQVSETLTEHCDRLAGLPLLFDPGTRWNYGSSTDVLGRVMEVVDDKPLDAVLRDRVLGPLGMDETAFWVPPDCAERFCATYGRADGELVELESSASSPYLSEPSMLSAAGGLVSTVDDYQRFVTMLVNGGEGVVGPRTIEFMASNHLPGGADLLASGGAATFSEATMAGVGFGLGFGVVMDPVANQSMATPGEFSWGGMASTAFWVDPVEQLTCVFMTQFMPSAYYPIRRQLRAVVNQAIEN